MNELMMQRQTMTSVQIAEATGKRHCDVLRAIQKMEPAWEKIGLRKFASSSYINKQGKHQPMYELTKTECLYIATKFNDEARARLVLRWEQLETEARRQWMEAQGGTARIGQPRTVCVDVATPCTTVQIARHLGLSSTELCLLLCDAGVMYRRGGRYYLKGTYVQQRYIMRRGCEYPCIRGRDTPINDHLWTMRGAQFIVNALERYRQVPHNQKDISPSSTDDKQ